MTVREDIVAKLGRDIERLEKELEGWREKFKENPSYALKWANSVFQKVAHYELYKLVYRELIEDEVLLVNLVDYLRKDLERLSRYLNQSTSPTSNLMKDCERVAIGEILDSFSGLLGEAFLRDLDDA